MNQNIQKLNYLFNCIKIYNKFTKPKLINENNNYYFFKIESTGYILDILKQSLIKMDNVDIKSEARYILNNY